MEESDMTGPGRRAKIFRFLCVCVLLVIGMTVGEMKFSFAAEKISANKTAAQIVIDPGHGGYDHGARGAGGSLEKAVSLNLARILSAELKPEYDVFFTRNGDYEQSLAKRASVANHHKVNLFIGIHTGGGGLRQMDGWSVFYYKKDASLNHGILKEPIGADRQEDIRLKWDQVQLDHQKESQVLAGCIKARLAGNPEIPGIEIAGAALRVLEGLDMPAIIIETGYLTHPTTENRLNDPEFLTDMAKRIKKGIDVYLTR